LKLNQRHLSTLNELEVEKEEDHTDDSFNQKVTGVTKRRNCPTVIAKNNRRIDSVENMSDLTDKLSYENYPDYGLV
jgi:hypothetical protein